MHIDNDIMTGVNRLLAMRVPVSTDERPTEPCGHVDGRSMPVL